MIVDTQSYVELGFIYNRMIINLSGISCLKPTPKITNSINDSGIIIENAIQLLKYSLSNGTDMAVGTSILYEYPKLDMYLLYSSR